MPNKENMKTIIAIVAVLALVGCASSGPVQTGKDTYMISKQSAGGVAVPGSKVKAAIIREANEFCATSGRETELIDSSSKNAIPFARLSSAEITFKCVAKQ